MKPIDKIDLSNAHIYFFYIFLFFLPLQTRKIFLTDYSFYSGSFTEYTTYFLYASDVFLSLAVLFWLFFNKKLIERIKRGGIVVLINNVIRSSKIWTILLVIVNWLVIDTIINNNYTEISAFQIIKFVEISFLIVYVYYNLKNRKKLITSLFVISATGFLQSIIAIYQFYFQHSLFNSPLLHKITGETIIGSNLPGVAKIVVDGDRIARAYGTLPHPNILGGFLIFSIMTSIYLYLEHKYYILSSIIALFSLLNQCLEKLKKVFLQFFKKNVFNNINNCIPSKEIGYNNTYNYICQHRNTILIIWTLFVFIQFVGLFFSFSRSAWLGFSIAVFFLLIFYFYTFLKNTNVSRETLLSFKSFKCLYSHFRNSILVKNYNKNENFLFISLITLSSTFFIIAYTSLISSRLDTELLYTKNNVSLDYNFDSRYFYNIVSRETIYENLFTGSGIGTSVFQINRYLKKVNITEKLDYWQYQPAHNVYLLIMSEIGLIGFLLLAFLVFSVLRCDKKNNIYIFLCDLNKKEKTNVPRETYIENNVKLNYFLISIFIGFLFIGLFDHYFWTTQQGRLTFWFILGIMSLNCGYKNIK